VTPSARREARPQHRRRRIRKAAVALPSGLTLANLFFGIFAIVSASRGDLQQAVLYVVLGGVADALDGRVARATGSGTALGEELDSLVDIVSFGLAPAMLMYFAVLNRNGWDWVFVFAYVACAALRLARFNVTQAGTSKRYFHGLPSPAAGLTLATYYWFSQTPLFTETNIVNLRWHVLLRFLMVGLGALMISEVSYPAVPTVGVRSRREIIGTVVVVLVVVGVFLVPKEFFFPALVVYDVWGLARLVFFGLIGRREVPEDLMEGERTARDVGELDYPERDHGLLPAEHSRGEGAASGARHRRRRRRRGSARHPDEGTAGGAPTSSTP